MRSSQNFPNLVLTVKVLSTAKSSINPNVLILKYKYIKDLFCGNVCSDVSVVSPIGGKTLTGPANEVNWPRLFVLC